MKLSTRAAQKKIDNLMHIIVVEVLALVFLYTLNTLKMARISILYFLNYH